MDYSSRNKHTLSISCDRERRLQAETSYNWPILRRLIALKCYITGIALSLARELVPHPLYTRRGGIPLDPRLTSISGQSRCQGDLRP